MSHITYWYDCVKLFCEGMSSLLKKTVEQFYITRTYRHIEYTFSDVCEWEMDIITFRLLFQVFVKIIYFRFTSKTKNGKVQMAIGLKTVPIIFIFFSSPFIRLKYDCGCGCELSNKYKCAKTKHKIQKQNIFKYCSHRRLSFPK